MMRYGIPAKGKIYLCAFALMATGAAAQQRTGVPLPSEGGISSVQAGQYSLLYPGRNLISNGSMVINQRGTGTMTCGTTSGVPQTSYSADRWGCIVNVTSGAGRQVYSTSSPPTGFSGYQTLFRTSGALTQPVCSVQEIETTTARRAAGKNVVLSFLAKDLGGLAADNGGVMRAVIVTGTGTDEGLGSFTASPAITPAWTGVSTLLNQTFTLSTSFQQFVTVPVPIAAGVNEIAVMMCFTPTASGAGATDGIGFTGVQLEVGDSPTAFDYRPAAEAILIAQRFYWRNTESAVFNSPCYVTGSNTQKCGIRTPVTMRAAPTVSVTAGGYSLVIDGAAPSAVSSFAGATSDPNVCNVTTGNTLTAAVHSVTLVGTGTTGIIECSADF